MTKKISPQKKDTRVDIPGYGHPFPDPSRRYMAPMQLKLYRKEPRIQEYNQGGEVERFIKKRHVKPSIPKFIEQQEMTKRILKNPRKHTTLI